MEDVEELKKTIRSLEFRVRNLEEMQGKMYAALRARGTLGPRKDKSKAIRRAINEMSKYTFNPTAIIHAVAGEFEVSVKQVLGRSRESRYVLPRQISIYLIRSFTQMSYSAIGDVFGRHHTTIVFAFQRMERMIESDDAMAESMDKIRSLVCEKVGS